MEGNTHGARHVNIFLTMQLPAGLPHQKWPVLGCWVDDVSNKGLANSFFTISEIVEQVGSEHANFL